MSVVPFLLYLLLVAMHVVILNDVTSIYTAQINLPALLVLLVALYKHDAAAAWFGFFVGLVASAGGPESQLGWQAALMAALAMVGCSIRQRLNLDSMKAKVIYMFGGILIHNLILLLISRAAFFQLQSAGYVLAGALYTTVFAWLFFLIKERQITVEKIKAIF